MNLTKKQMMVAAIVIGAVAVWYFFIRKKKLESGYDENVMIIGNENGYVGQGIGTRGTERFRRNLENNYSTSAVTSTSPTKAATSTAISTQPFQPVGSNEGQKCNKDHQCSPGLYCVNGRCGKKGRGMVSTGWIKGSPYTGESGYERKKGPLDTSPTFPEYPGSYRKKKPYEPTPTYPGSPFGRTEIACTPPKHWNGWTCVESGPEPKGNIAERTMISCPPGTIMSGGQCVPVGGGSSESNWWGSDWANAVTKDLNRWSKNK